MDKTTGKPKMEEIIIRKAVLDDLDHITEIWKDFIDYHAAIHPIYARRHDGHLNATKFFADCIDADDHELFVADDQGKIIGYSLINISEYPPVFLIEKHGLILDMYVVPEYQREGIGQKFMEIILPWFREREIQNIHLRVVHGNERGINFWRKVGFKKLIYEMKLDLE